MKTVAFLLTAVCLVVLALPAAAQVHPGITMTAVNNSTTHVATITYTLAARMEIHFQVSSLPSGEPLYVFVNKQSQPAGRYIQKWDTRSLPAGEYMFTIIADGKIRGARLRFP